MSPPERIKLWVAEDGTVTFVYDDDVAAVLAGLGLVHTQRAAHVEPDGYDGWTVQLVAGDRFGPFPTRGTALAAEAALIDDLMSGGQP